MSPTKGILWGHTIKNGGSRYLTEKNPSPTHAHIHPHHTDPAADTVPSAERREFRRHPQRNQGTEGERGATLFFEIAQDSIHLQGSGVQKQEACRPGGAGMKRQLTSVARRATPPCSRNVP